MPISKNEFKGRKGFSGRINPKDEILELLMKAKKMKKPAYSKEDILKKFDVTPDKYTNDSTLFDLVCVDFEIALTKLLMEQKIISNNIKKDGKWVTYYMAK